MRYMCLIYTNETADAARSEAEQGEIMQGYFAFTEEVRGKGVMEAGDPLMPTDTATTVRVEAGQPAGQVQNSVAHHSAQPRGNDAGAVHRVGVVAGPPRLRPHVQELVYSGAH